MADVTNYTIENASGANVRTDLNNVFAAIQSSNSKSTDLATSQCVAGMPFLNTTTNILKIRNSTNNGFTNIGNIDQANLGLLPRSGGSSAPMTGALLGHDGSNAAAPAFSFDTDSDLGLFRKAANIMGFSSAGTEQMIFDANGITLRSQNEIRFGDNDNSHYAAMKAGTITSNRTLTLPNESGTVLTSATSIQNTNLANSSITIGSTSISLGGSNTTIAGISTLTATNLRATNFQDTNGNTLFTDTQIAQGRVKAYVNFNGQGTVAKRDDFNVSSVSDIGTGVYDINFATAMSDTNYTVVMSNDLRSVNNRVAGIDSNNVSTSSFRVTVEDPNQSYGSGTSRMDCKIIGIAVFGDT